MNSYNETEWKYGQLLIQVQISKIRIIFDMCVN